MHPLVYLPLFAAWLVALISPGPDFLTVLRLSAGGSRRSGVLAGLGVVTGQAAWVIAALAGVTALLDRYERVYLVLRLAGALFLIGYGLIVLRGAWRRRAAADVGPVGDAGRAVDAGRAPDAPDLGRQPPASAWRSWRLGLVCNLSNPKALVFFGALFATVLPPHLGTGERVGIVAVMVGMGLGWFLLVATVASVPAASAAYTRARRMIETVTGGLFVAVGGALVPR